MSGLLLTALLLVDPRSVQVDVSGGVAVETRVGRAPVTPVAEPVLSFLAIVTPDVAMQVDSRRGGVFTLGYSPRIQYRVPNRINLQRPLFLHTITSTYDATLSRRWLTDMDFGASVGEIDYTGINIALGNNAATPDIAVVNFVFGSGSTDFTWLAAPRHRLTFGPAFDIRSPLENSRNPGSAAIFAAIPTQTQADFGITYEHDLTLRDTIDVTTAPGIIDYDFETSFFAADTRVGWDHIIVPNLSSRLDAGVFGATLVRGELDDLDGNGAPEGRPTAIFPVGSAALNGRVYARSTHTVDVNVGFETIGFFDRVTSRVDPRGQLTAGVTTNIPPRWAVAVQGSAYTALTPRPRPRVGMIEIPETVIRGQTPVTCTINDNSAFEFGAIVSVRGSHLAAEQFTFRQLETWLYVAFRIGGGTARGGEEVAGRGEGQIGTGTQGIGAPLDAGTR